MEGENLSMTVRCRYCGNEVRQEDKRVVFPLEQNPDWGESEEVASVGHLDCYVKATIQFLGFDQCSTSEGMLELLRIWAEKP